MALSDWTSLIMPDGEKRWKAAGRKPKVDKRPEQRRNKVLAGIDNALRQLAGNEPSPRRGWYSTKGDVCRATVRLGARPLPLNGAEPQVYIPADRASDFYQGVRAHVESGGFDEAIAQLYDKSDTAGRTRARGARRRSATRERGAPTTSADEPAEAAAETAPKSGGNKADTQANASPGDIAPAQSDRTAARSGRSRRSPTTEPGATPKSRRTARTKTTPADAVATKGGTEPARKRRSRKKSPATPE